MAKYWYIYNNVEDPFDASSYEVLYPPNKPTCTTGGTICAIYATASNSVNSPQSPLSANLLQYIAFGLTGSGVPQPDYGAKPFVYLKD